jgi:hypothetical protein
MTVSEHAPIPLPWWGWLGRVALALALLVALAGSLNSTISLASNRSRDAAEALGFFGSPSPLGSAWVELKALHPQGAAAKAGLRPGDAIRFRHLMGQYIGWRPGELVAVDLARGAHRSVVSLVAQSPRARIAGMAGIRLAMSVQPLLTLVLCVFILVRGWRKAPAVLLTAILVSLYLEVPTFFLPHGLATALLLASAPALAVAAPLWPMFCLEISRDRTRRRSGLVYALAAVIGAESAWVVAGTYLPVPLPVPADSTNAVIDIVVQVIGFAVLASNYRMADPVTRNRIKIVALAFACLLLQGLFFQVASNLLMGGVTLGQLAPTAIAISLSGYAAVIVLSYAVLRQHLFDIGFAINRTLVYGAVSFTLLAAFGLAERGAEHIIPEAWQQDSAIYSAGIAIVLFLCFHRLRDWFEHHIERLFFASWHRNEAELKRFVASAPHFEQRRALCREFVGEVERFAHGAVAALYLRGESGGYELQCGAHADTPERYTDDNRLFATMRAERQPVDMAHVQTALPGALALPMLDQLGLAGFALLGARPDGAPYRPDEIAALGWATQQVGLDLQALQARELREEVAELRQLLAARRRRPPKLTTISAAASA